MCSSEWIFYTCDDGNNSLPIIRTPRVGDVVVVVGVVFAHFVCALVGSWLVIQNALLSRKCPLIHYDPPASVSQIQLPTGLCAIVCVLDARLEMQLHLMAVGDFVSVWLQT